jgi:hypothetical protein
MCIDRVIATVFRGGPERPVQWPLRVAFVENQDDAR